jgi:hypothetical protein
VKAWVGLEEEIDQLTAKYREEQRLRLEKEEKRR